MAAQWVEAAVLVSPANAELDEPFLQLPLAWLFPADQLQGRDHQYPLAGVDLLSMQFS